MHTLTRTHTHMHAHAGRMGVTLDLTPAGLIQFAIERKQGAGEDWEGFKARHSQVFIRGRGEGTTLR